MSLELPSSFVKSTTTPLSFLLLPCRVGKCLMFHLVVVYLCNFELLFCRTMSKRKAIFNRGTSTKILWQRFHSRDSILKDSWIIDHECCWSQFIDFFFPEGAFWAFELLKVARCRRFLARKKCHWIEQVHHLHWKITRELLFLHRILDRNRHFPRPLNSAWLVLRLDRLDQNARCPELWRRYFCRNLASC